MQLFYSLLSWRLFTAQHVLGVFPPIIRNSMTAEAASGFTFMVTVVLCLWSGRLCNRYHHDTKVKPEAATAVIELLMMGGKTPEICWAVNKCQDNKLENCGIWLVIYLNYCLSVSLCLSVVLSLYLCYCHLFVVCLCDLCSFLLACLLVCWWSSRYSGMCMYVCMCVCVCVCVVHCQVCVCGIV
jgi:hypothetical protein